MKKFLPLIIFVLFTITACGKTNYFSWTQSQSSSSLELAKQSLDEGKYNKAESILRDILRKKPNDQQANILYAQALMGKAKLDLAKFVTDINQEKPAYNNSPLLKLQATIDRSDRELIYQAADLFTKYTPANDQDKLVGAMCTATAVASILSDKFDPTAKGIENVTDADINTQTGDTGGNTVKILRDISWSGDPEVKNKHKVWTNRSIILLTVVATGDVQSNVEHISTLIDFLSAYSDSTPVIPWSNIKNGLFLGE